MYGTVTHQWNRVNATRHLEPRVLTRWRPLNNWPTLRSQDRRLRELREQKPKNTTKKKWPIPEKRGKKKKKNEEEEEEWNESPWTSNGVSLCIITFHKRLIEDRKEKKKKPVVSSSAHSFAFRQTFLPWLQPHPAYQWATACTSSQINFTYDCLMWFILYNIMPFPEQ